MFKFLSIFKINRNEQLNNNNYDFHEAETPGIDVQGNVGAQMPVMNDTAPSLGGFEDEALRTRPEAFGKLRQAQEAWLERRGVLEDTPHLVMTKREIELLRVVGLRGGSDITSFLIDQIRKNYGVPPGAQYASVDIVPNDVSQPHDIKLVAVGEEDFGTEIDEGRLEGPESIPRITMKEREFGLFKIVGIDSSTTPSIFERARDICGISRDDQYAPKYALVDIESGDLRLPNEPLLVDIAEADFGTTIDADLDDKYLQNPDSDPDSPLTPESGGRYRTVDIAEDGTLDRSEYGLQKFATELMKGRTTNPLSEISYWMRAGDIATGQKDAYVWENNKPFASAVELTIAFPGQYDSVCAVAGDRQDAANGKPGMAQIKDPAVILKIEGEHLRRLQEIYKDLYRVPDFALTEAQRSARDEQFNFHTFGLIYEATSENQARESAEAYPVQQQPPLRAREH